MIDADDAIAIKGDYAGRRSLSDRSRRSGHRYLEDAPAAASLFDSSKIVFQTDRKAGGHRVRECGGGERTVSGRGVDGVHSVCKTRRRVDPTPSSPPSVSSPPSLTFSLSLSLVAYGSLAFYLLLSHARMNYLSLSLLSLSLLSSLQRRPLRAARYFSINNNLHRRAPLFR